MVKKKNAPERMRVSFELRGPPAKRRSMYKWFRQLEKDGMLCVEMEALYETQTAFSTPEELAKRYDMMPEDFEVTG
ncbi:MAG: hypothetical protein HN975_10765 [Anaerolineae bacterium]|jgi:hypothetical protein|nr:hypothetical protein [Anaerolineae bacterium]